MSLLTTQLDLTPLTTRTPDLLLAAPAVFDAEAVLGLRGTVLQAVADGAVLVLLDLAPVTRITPSAVAGLVDFLRMARAAGGDFRAFGDSPALHSARRALQLTSVIRVYATRTDAISSGF